MGLFSFVKDAGRKFGLFGGKEAAAAEDAAESAATAAKAAEATADAAERQLLLDQAVAHDIKAAIASHSLSIADLVVSFSGETATLGGVATSQEDCEKCVLIAGNTAGVASVDDQIAVEIPAPPAIHHTVVSGDTLSKIALAQYGNMRLYDVIFEANKPMLKHPDEIYPGQVLRIPRIAHHAHTVVKGETLGGIAKHYYGNAKRYSDIFDANTDSLSSPDAISVGQTLRIPLSGPASQLLA